MEEVFAAESISRQYGKKNILTDCTIRAFAGECTGIAGRNGSGKSTLLAVCAGAQKPGSGRVTAFGEDIFSKGSSAMRRIGYVPQNDPLIADLSVNDNLRLFGGRNVSENEPFFRALGLEGLGRMKVSSLSGGMKRRVSIGCALTDDPDILIMDEPTSSLDIYHRSVIFDYLSAFRAKGGTVIMATHDIEEMALCDRLYLISGGQAEECSPAEAASRIKGGN